jgi:hypothetical protein
MKRPEWTRDAIVPSLALFAGLVVAGFVSIALAWRLTARSLHVALQTPAVVSGGLGGLALIALGAGLATTQVGRRLAAQERAELEAVLDEAAALVAVVAGTRR